MHAARSSHQCVAAYLPTYHTNHSTLTAKKIMAKDNHKNAIKHATTVYAREKDMTAYLMPHCSPLHLNILTDRDYLALSSGDKVIKRINYVLDQRQ